MPTDPALAEELVATVRRWVAKEVIPNASEFEHADEFPEAITGVRSPASLGGTTCSVSLVVDDADAWFERAKSAGATVVRDLADEYYGRSGRVRDPFGHTWGITGPVKAK